MRMIAPRTGAHEITLAEEQLEYSPLVAAVYSHPDFGGAPYLLTRWQPSDEDLARLLGVDVEAIHQVARVRDREDVYLAILTGGAPLQPLSMQVGPDGYLVTVAG